MTSTNATAPAPIEYSTEIDCLFGSLCLGFFLIGAPANFFSFLSFLHQRRTVSSFTYSCITLVDCLICVNALPVALTYFSDRRPLLFSSSGYCNVWGICHRLLSSLSIFYVAVLSISRTFVLLRPFAKLNLFLVQVVVGVHLLSQIVFVSIPYWEKGGMHVYSESYATCEAITTPDNTFSKEYNVLSRITYSMPILPILVSCIISVWIIRRDAAQLTDSLRRTKQYASVTIVIFTLIYAALNIPNTTISIFEWGGYLYNLEPTSYLLNFVYYTSIPLNATLNTVLYFVRMYTLRQSLILLVQNALHRRPVHFHMVFSMGTFRSGTLSRGGRQSLAPKKRMVKVGDTMSSPVSMVGRALKDDTTPV